MKNQIVNIYIEIARHSDLCNLSDKINKNLHFSSTDVS